MTIDPPSPPGNGLQALKTQQQANLESLSRTLDIKVGQTVTGTVLQATPVTAQTRQTLLDAYVQRLNSGATSAPNNTTTNTNAGTLAPSPELTTLQAPKLQLLQVLVKQQQLLTFTDIPVQKHQQVQLQLKAANVVSLLQPLPTAQSLPKGSPAANYAQSPQASAPVNTSTLQQALRTSLPQQAPIHQLSQGQQVAEALQVSLQLTQLSQNLGSYSAQSLIPKTLQDALKTAATHLRTPAQLSNPETLKQTLQGSGVQLEARLKSFIDKRVLNTPLNSAQGNSVTPHKLPQQDLKAALLALLNRTQQTSPGTATQRPSATPAQNTPQNTLLIILKTLLQSSPQLTQVRREIPREALIQQLQQLVQLALGKIQYQQLQALSRRQSGNSENTPITNHHWQLEIPVRLGTEVHPLHLQIDEQWVQARQESTQQEEEDEPGKKRKWFIKLSFELPDAGYFHAHLSIIDDSVNASLWAENPETLKKAQQQLSELKARLDKAGVNVKSLDCFPGKPTLQDNRLSYSLVDVKT